MRVLRGLSGDFSLRLPCITRPTSYVRYPIGLWDPLVWVYLSTSVYRSCTDLVTCRGSAVQQEFFLSILYLLLFNIWFIPNLIEWLGYDFQYLVWAAIFEYGFYFILLYYYLAGLLDISIYLKGSLILPLVGTESLPFCYLFISLYYYLAGLFEISVCPKGFLFWPLVSTEKVKSFFLAPDWYRESLICYYILFLIYG
jgi:hypothetical protein